MRCIVNIKKQQKREQYTLDKNTKANIMASELGGKQIQDKSLPQNTLNKTKTKKNKTKATLKTQKTPTKHIWIFYSGLQSEEDPWYRS